MQESTYVTLMFTCNEGILGNRVKVEFVSTFSETYFAFFIYKWPHDLQLK